MSSFDPYVHYLKVFAHGLLAMWKSTSNTKQDFDWWHSIQINDQVFDVNFFFEDESLSVVAYFVSENGDLFTDDFETLLSYTKKELELTS